MLGLLARSEAYEFGQLALGCPDSGNDPCGLGIRIQPTFVLVRVVRVDYSRDMNCPMPPAHRMLGLPAFGGAYEFGQLGSGNILFHRRMSFFFKEPTASLRGVPELQP